MKTFLVRCDLCNKVIHTEDAHHMKDGGSGACCSECFEEQ